MLKVSFLIQNTFKLRSVDESFKRLFDLITTVYSDIECIRISSPVNGRSSCDTDWSPNNGTNCSITCNSGFGLTSPGELTCEGTDHPGTWNPSIIPLCGGKDGAYYCHLLIYFVI